MIVNEGYRLLKPHYRYKQQDGCHHNKNQKEKKSKTARASRTAKKKCGNVYFIRIKSALTHYKVQFTDQTDGRTNLSHIVTVMRERCEPRTQGRSAHGLQKQCRAYALCRSRARPLVRGLPILYLVRT